MMQELKTILIVVSATLAALFAHQLIEQSQATAGTVVWPSIPAAVDEIPTFE